jgi:hypothetical protein
VIGPSLRSMSSRDDFYFVGGGGGVAEGPFISRRVLITGTFQTRFHSNNVSYS